MKKPFCRYRTLILLPTLISLVSISLLYSSEPNELLQSNTFIPHGGIAHLAKQDDIDLFTKGKSVGHVQDNPDLEYRRLVQRTIMLTEPLPRYGCVLTFDDHLNDDHAGSGSAIQIVQDLAPLRAKAIFFANVPEVSEKSINSIFKRHRSSEARIAACKQLLESKREVMVQTIRELIRIKLPADKNGHQHYAAEVFNHTAFHQNMSQLKVHSDRFKVCLLGIEFIEECIDSAYGKERPDWQRARYFRFPFLHSPKDKATKAKLNQVFTNLGLICLGETQDSKDFENHSHQQAFASISAAQRHQRYKPDLGPYESTEQPIALFHTKTWPHIRKGVIKAIKLAP